MYLFTFLITLLISFSLFAKNNSCTNIKQTRELYLCALENHPEYKAATMNQDIAKASGAQVSQWPNPELSIKSVSGKNAGENVGGTEVAVSIDVTELLIKRPALYSAGKSERKLLTVSAQEDEFKAKSQIIKDLYRYRQLLDELELVSEALETFKKIENQFRARKVRGPEQEITLNLVELAQGDYELRKNHLALEKADLESKYKGVFGEKFEFKKDFLPPLQKNWPEVQSAQVSKNTFDLRRAEAERERSEAEKSIALMDSFPKIAAGPVFERTTEGPTQYTSSGFNVTASIPIFSWNGGARGIAEKNKIKAQLMHDYAIKKADLDKELIFQKYKSAVESLKKATSAEALKKKHERIDSLFRQGLTSGNTVIEAHRQILEFTESQHEHEITALDSLMYIHVLSGKDAGEVIK